MKKDAKAGSCSRRTKFTISDQVRFTVTLLYEQRSVQATRTRALCTGQEKNWDNLVTLSLLQCIIDPWGGLLERLQAGCA